MSTEPTTLPAAGAPSQAAAPAARAGGKPKFDPRYLAPLLVTCVLLGAHFFARVLVSPEKTGLAILAAVLVEVVAGRLMFGQVPHLASAYVTGISVGILLRAEQFYWPYAYCSAISILSKYVIRVRGRHIWNPSNLGIAVTLVVAPWAVHTLNNEFSNSLWAMAVIWLLGSFIISRLRRFHICVTYVLSFLAFAGVRHLVTGHPLAAEVAPITGPMYQLFTFFMITDPKTTVQCKKGQMIVAFTVALVECGFRLWGGALSENLQIHAPYYALFFVGPVANLVEIYRTPKAPPQPVGRV